MIHPFYIFLRCIMSRDAADAVWAEACYGDAGLALTYVLAVLAIWGAAFASLYHVVTGVV